MDVTVTAETSEGTQAACLELPFCASQASSGVDFMHVGYDGIGLPLNLLGRGRQWFVSVLHSAVHGRTPDRGMVLGGVPWMTSILETMLSVTFVVDTNGNMLRLVNNSRPAPSAAVHKIVLVHDNWLTLPDEARGLDLVLGDNSVSFVVYPDEWKRLLVALSGRMNPDAVLITRACSVPTSHRKRSIDAIVEQFSRSAVVNYTEVRTALLFNQWDPMTFSIDTESALDEFEANRHKFEALLSRDGANETNDLRAITKYRKSGAIYYAPPLPEVLEAFNIAFDVTEVHFGPYPMADYFPLIVARKR